MSLKIKFIDFCSFNELFEDWHIPLWIEFVFCRVLSRGNKTDCLINSLNFLNSSDTISYSLSYFLYSFILLLRFLCYGIINFNEGLLQLIKIHKHLISGLNRMHIIAGDIEIVVCDKAVCTFVHTLINIYTYNLSKFIKTSKMCHIHIPFCIKAKNILICWITLKIFNRAEFN